jgi:cytidylate kinase
MHITETFTATDVIPETKVVTFDGEGRGGKGTSVEAVRASLASDDRDVLVIDQGKKFRALTLVALRHRSSLLDSPDELTRFLRIDATRADMQALLDEAAAAKAAGDLHAYDELDSKETGAASAKVGRIETSHRIAIASLFEKVEEAAASSVDTVLIDGRHMEKYGREIAERKTAQYVLGFYFRCDASVAARRSLGLIADVSTMTTEQKLSVMDEMVKVYERNRSDTLRMVDPMRQPHGALELDLAAFDVNDHAAVQQLTLDALRHGMVSLNTSYTRTIDEMTVPIVTLSRRAIELHDQERKKYMQNPKLWGSSSLFDDPRRFTISDLSELSLGTE